MRPSSDWPIWPTAIGWPLGVDRRGPDRLSQGSLSGLPDRMRRGTSLHSWLGSARSCIRPATYPMAHTKPVFSRATRSRLRDAGAGGPVTVQRCHVDVGRARRIGAAAGASPGRTAGGKAQRLPEFSGSEMVELTPREALHRAQGEEQAGLEAVAGADGVDDLGLRRVDCDGARLAMPGLGAAHTKRDDEEAGSGRKQTLGPLGEVVAAMKIGKVTVRQAYDVGDAREA